MLRSFEDGTDTKWTWRWGRTLVYLLLTNDWAVILGPDGTVGFPDSEVKVDDQRVWWVESNGEEEVFGTLSRDGETLRVKFDGEDENTAFRWHQNSMSRGEAISFLAKRYRENPEAYHNKLGGGRRVVLPPSDRLR